MAGQLECSWAQQRQEHGVAVEGGRVMQQLCVGAGRRHA